MTKKITLVFVLFLFVFGLRAESLLNEGFEGWSTTNFPTGGWTVINDTQEGAINHWTVDNSKSACAGSVSLYCNGGEWDPIEPVKEEWIVSPSLTLSETNYNLSFLWKGASASAFKNEYDFQVRITEDDGKSWKTVFSFLDQSMVENSGVAFPWTGWVTNTSKISLGAYSGKTVKIAFVHCLLVSGAGKGNSIWVDNVVVETGEAIDAPIADVNPTSYIFDGTYIGVGKWSEKFVLRNKGVGNLTVSGISGLEGSDFSTNMIPSEVSLRPSVEYEFYVKYTPSSELSSKSATMTIHTNGGDVSIVLEGTKIILPDEYNLENLVISQNFTS